MKNFKKLSFIESAIVDTNFETANWSLGVRMLTLVQSDTVTFFTKLVTIILQ
jgi:hypothetical protein